jgi:hypothetical protein
MSQCNDPRQGEQRCDLSHSNDPGDGDSPRRLDRFYCINVTFRQAAQNGTAPDHHIAARKL